MTVYIAFLPSESGPVRGGTLTLTRAPRTRRSSPSRSRIAWFCSRVCGSQPGREPVAPPGWASSAELRRPASSRRASPPSQRAMCSSDRKRFMVLQVKTMSSHHLRGRDEAVEEERSRRRAGRRGPRRRAARRSRGTTSRSGRPCASAAQIPNASHAQFAYHQRSPAGRDRRSARRERVDHPQLVGRGIEDERHAPSWRRRHACEHLLRIAQLARRPARGRAPRRTRSPAAQPEIGLVHLHDAIPSRA